MMQGMTPERPPTPAEPGQSSRDDHHGQAGSQPGEAHSGRPMRRAPFSLYRPTSDQPGTVFFKNPNLDPSKYRSIYIEAATVYDEPGAIYKNVTDEDKSELAGFLTAEFTRAVTSKHALAAAPGPGVMVIKLTLTGA